MISYAQNFEDVILWRALKHIKTGRYIDIGAWDPVVDSVSMFFYAQGWRGIHVEPNPFYSKKLREARPDEAVIEAAIGDCTAPTTLFVIENTGLTTSSEKFRDEHKLKGFTSETIKVPTRTLASIFDEVGEKEIHWLKIDAEGMEENVIRSWGNNPARPWIVVVESTLPSTDIEVSYGLNELTALGYTNVYFDALNKFYVHKLHPELLSSFRHGPNVFDDFIRADHNKMRDQAEILNKDLIERTKELVDTRAELLERTKLLEKANVDLAARTKALVDNRAELLKSTKLIEKYNGDLAARTKELVDTRAELLKRTKLIEKYNDDLAARTKELNDIRAELLERTKLLEKANVNLAARTKKHAQLEKESRKQTEELMQKEHEVNRLTNELIEEKNAHKELQMILRKNIFQIKVAEKTINLVAFASNPLLYFLFRKLIKEIFEKISLLSRKL
jgi:hypothetical protein